MTRPCDRCGARVVDTTGTRQASLFDLDGDPRSTDAARAELRQGRILCPACQRTPELFADDTAESTDPAALAHVDAALGADAVADLNDGPGPTTSAHKWRWTGQGERLAFGDPDRPYAVDFYRCDECGKEVTIRGTKNPHAGRCKGRVVR